MLFNSLSFLIFFPVVTTLYFLLPQRFRWMLLLAASCVFYMAFIPYYILILFVTITIDYYAGIQIEKTTGSKRKLYLIISIVSTCAVLVIFKYFNFFNANLSALAHFIGWNYSIGLFNIILPIGLSFHTFQSLSYVIEVYRGRQKAEHHFGIYALYVMFYPQLVAGPIERPQNLLHQFYEYHKADSYRIIKGLRRMLWGFFKKIVIADNLAMYVNQAYGHPDQFSGLALLTATFFFAVQIYCDFSGYSDIAVGTAQVMGFNLMENFKTPYFALSIAEFWRRWHISLSTWFKDYVYVPLGGNRVGPSTWAFNILVTFVLSGLWHGANWTYIIWGFLHGFYIISSRILQKFTDAFLPAVHRIGPWLVISLQRFFVFVLVLLTWVFFRASTVSQAIYIVNKSVTGTIHLSGGFSSLLAPLYTVTSHGAIYFGFFWFILAVFAVTEAVEYKKGLMAFLDVQPRWIRWTAYAVVLMCIMNLGVSQEMRFIYFQF